MLKSSRAQHTCYHKPRTGVGRGRRVSSASATVNWRLTWAIGDPISQTTKRFRDEKSLQNSDPSTPWGHRGLHHPQKRRWYPTWTRLHWQELYLVLEGVQVTCHIPPFLRAPPPGLEVQSQPETKAGWSPWHISKCWSPDISVADPTCRDMSEQRSLSSQVPNRILEAVYLKMEKIHRSQVTVHTVGSGSQVGHVWWQTPVLPAVRKLRPEDQEFT